MFHNPVDVLAAEKFLEECGATADAEELFTFLDSLGWISPDALALLIQGAGGRITVLARDIIRYTPDVLIIYRVENNSSITYGIREAGVPNNG